MPRPVDETFCSSVKDFYKKKKHLKQTLNNMQFLSERIKYDIGGQIDKRYDIQTDSQTDRRTLNAFSRF